MENQESRVALSLLSVFLGWVLGQGTTVFRDWRTRNRLKESLFLELSDLRVQVERRGFGYKRYVQGATIGLIEQSVHNSIHSYFFDNHYKDIFSKLNRNQRLSYQLIHESIQSLNDLDLRLEKKADEIIKIMKSTGDKEIQAKQLNEWRELTSYAFIYVNETLWHIDYHLSNKRNPVLDFLAPMHEAFLKHKAEVEKSLTTIIEMAKEIPSSKFDQTYDPKDFHHDTPVS